MLLPRTRQKLKRGSSPGYNRTPTKATNRLFNIVAPYFLHNFMVPVKQKHSQSNKMYFNSLPDHSKAGFDETRHFDKFGKHNIIFHAESKESYCDDHVGSFPSRRYGAVKKFMALTACNWLCAPASLTI